MDRLDVRGLMILCSETRLFYCSNGHHGVSVQKMPTCPICWQIREKGYW